MAPLHRSFSLRKLYADIQSLKQMIDELQDHDEIQADNQSHTDESKSRPKPAPIPEGKLEASMLPMSERSSDEAFGWHDINDPENPMNWRAGG